MKKTLVLLLFCFALLDVRAQLLKINDSSYVATEGAIVPKSFILYMYRSGILLETVNGGRPVVLQKYAQRLNTKVSNFNCYKRGCGKKVSPETVCLTCIVTTQ